MTKLTTIIRRETDKRIQGENLILVLVPGSVKREALVGAKRKGRQTTYFLTVSDIYRYGALAFGNAERAARKQARRDGVSWRIARRQFLASYCVNKM